MAIKVSKFIELLKNWTLSLRKLDVTSTSYRAALATTLLPPSSVFDYTKIVNNKWKNTRKINFNFTC